MDIQKRLCAEIETELKSLKDVNVGSNEYKATVDGIAKLTDKLIDLKKLDADCEEKAASRAADIDMKSKQLDEQIESREKDLELKRQQLDEQIKSREADIELKTKQLEEEKKSRLIGNCISAAGIVVPVIVTVWGTLKSFEFEKEGTVTTIMGRGFIGKLLPRK